MTKPSPVVQIELLKGQNNMTPPEGIAYLLTLPEDEPVMVFRGRDAFAPAAVQCWAAMCTSQGSMNHEKNEALASTRAKGERAMHLASEMRAYQRKNRSKMPD